MKQNDTYSTSDLTEIVFLFCRGVPLCDTERQGQRVVFNFEGKAFCSKLVANIAYGRDEVRLTTALSEIRRARDIMHKTV
jgi:hypothetical protein